MISFLEKCVEGNIENTSKWDSQQKRWKKHDDCNVISWFWSPPSYIAANYRHRWVCHLFIAMPLLVPIHCSLWAYKRSAFATAVTATCVQSQQSAELYAVTIRQLLLRKYIHACIAVDNAASLFTVLSGCASSVALTDWCLGSHFQLELILLHSEANAEDPFMWKTNAPFIAWGIRNKLAFTRCSSPINWFWRSPFSFFFQYCRQCGIVICFVSHINCIWGKLSEKNYFYFVLPHRRLDKTNIGLPWYSLLQKVTNIKCNTTPNTTGVNARGSYISFPVHVTLWTYPGKCPVNLRTTKSKWQYIHHF